MAAAWTWDLATETLTVTGGTVNSPITLDDFDGELVQTIELLGSTVRAENLSLTRQPFVCPSRGVRITVTVTAGTPNIADSVTITGTDHRGDAVWEQVFVGFGDTLRTTTKRFATVDAGGVDCSGLDFSFKIEQILLEAIIKATDKSYVVGVNLAIGDGSTPTYLLSNDELVAFGTGYGYTVNPVATTFFIGFVPFIPGDDWWPFGGAFYPRVARI